MNLVALSPAVALVAVALAALAALIPCALVALAFVVRAHVRRALGARRLAEAEREGRRAAARDLASWVARDARWAAQDERREAARRERREALAYVADAALTEVVGSPVSEPETLTLADEADWYEARAKHLARRALAENDRGWWEAALDAARAATALRAQARGR